MLTETGCVVALENDVLWVETIRRSTCGSCAAQSGCGHGLMNRITDGRRAYLRVLAGDVCLADCAVDDQVRFTIPEEVILRGSFIAYLLPLACMVLGALAAVAWLPGSEDALAACGAAAGLGVGFGLVRWHATRHRDDTRFQPVLLEILRLRTDPRPWLKK